MREGPRGDPIEGPEQQPWPLALQVAAQPEIENILYSVAKSFASIREEEMRQQMAPGPFTGVAIEIGFPMVSQLRKCHDRSCVQHFLRPPYVMFPNFTQSVYPLSSSVCLAVLGFPLVAYRKPDRRAAHRTIGGCSCQNARSGSCWGDW